MMHKRHRANIRAAGDFLLLVAVLFVCFLVPLSSLAFDAQFDVQPRLLSVGESATFTLILHGAKNPPPPQLPPIDGIQVSGPNRSSSSNIQMINGKVTKENSVTFHYSLLPLRAGSFEVGPFRYHADGQALEIPAVTLKVVDPQAKQGQSGQPEGQQPNLFARLTVSPTNLYNQQVFDLVVEVYHRGLNLGRGPELDNLPSAGFKLEGLQNLGARREAVGNEVYEVRKTRTRVRALTAGSFTLSPTVRVEVRTPRSRQRNRGFFDGFFSPMQSQVVNIQPEPITVQIRPLPTEGRPEHFSGAVGQFTFDIQAKPTDLNVGDPITISMLITGNGNIENVVAPEIVHADDFKVYDARLIAQDANRKHFEQVVLPRADTITDLPRVAFSYFDPTDGQYKSIARGPIDLTVHASSNSAVQLLGGATTFAQQEARVLGSDIVYLKPLPEHWASLQSTPWYTQRRVLALQALPLLGLFLLAGVIRRRDTLDKDQALARRQKAPRSARAGLERAEKALRDHSPSGFYEAVWDALASYFGNRFNLPPGAVVPQEVLASLREAQLPDADCGFLEKMFSQCEQARFGALSERGELTSDDTLLQLRRILKQCERIRIK